MGKHSTGSSKPTVEISELKVFCSSGFDEVSHRSFVGVLHSSGTPLYIEGGQYLLLHLSFPVFISCPQVSCVVVDSCVCALCFSAPQNPLLEVQAL